MNIYSKIIAGDTVNMDNNPEDNVANSSVFSLIDVIDLTNESPIRAPQSHGRLQNTHENDNISIDLSDNPPPKKIKQKKSKAKRSLSCMKTTENLDDTIYITDDEKHITESDKEELLSLTCPICFEPLSSKLKPTTTRCGHVFCEQCLEANFHTSKLCPTCKRSITLKSCTRLFL